MASDTMVDRLFGQADRQNQRPALWYQEGSSWKHWTWGEYADAVRRFAGGLIGIGFEPKDCIVIMGNNSPEWLIADVGAMAAGGCPAGIYQTSTQDQAVYIAAHCEAKVYVIEDASLFERMDMPNALKEMPTVEKVVVIKDADRLSHDLVVSFEDFLASGTDHLPEVAQRVKNLEEDQMATLIYTSGTTGPPKGVMLSHKNLAFTSKVGIDMIGSVNSEDCVVSYLPLSHIAEQMFSVQIAITAGYPIWCCDDLTKLKDTLVVARPTLFLAVPRVWEKFKTALELKLGEAEGAKATIVDWALGVGADTAPTLLQQGEGGLGLGQKLKRAAANKLFTSKLKAGLGLDRLEIAVTGAAPIGRDVLDFFAAAGIIIHEVYGQSEDCGPTSFNQPFPGKRRLGSVGLPLPKTEVKIAEDGEILVKGDHVFMGYYKNPDATAETLKDGWLYSGDVGRFDDDGFLYITDRKKDLLITAGGKNVAPQNIEKLMKNIDGISQAVVIGDRRKFLSALMTLDPERAPVLAEERGWPIDPAQLVKHPEFIEHVQKGVDRGNGQLARYETIKKFTVLPDDFTTETGELTPTMKVKRKVVNEKFADAIEAFYAGLD